MTWVYFLSNKSQVFSVFKKFRAFAERQSGCKLKALRSDNGGEYTSNEFNKYCKDMGIDHKLTVSYSPEQNGVSERKNRTVVEMARCLLLEKKLPQSFWAEAVHTSLYLLNRLPTKAVNEKTPIEAWSGIQPSAKHLKVFGSICYSHVPSVKRSKLEPKGELGIFIGYSSQAKGYRVFNLQTKSISIRRDVVVDEHAYWNWDKEQIEKDNAVFQNLSPLPEIKSFGSETLEEDEESDGESSLDSPILKTRSLSEIYERCNVAISEPNSYQEASRHEVWIEAMKEEIVMIEKNDTWKLVDKPKNRNVIGVKWVYRTKLNPDSSVCKYKARLVVKGYAQVAGLDYGDTFAPVARHDTIRLLFALAAQSNWKLYHLDVKSAFLNGLLQEEIYVDQPEGFQVAGMEDKVYRLHKALYGLKQAPRAWYSKIDDHLIHCGFKRSENEATLYVKKAKGGDVFVVSLYVDDLLVTGSNKAMVNQFMQEMETKFEMSDLGEMSYFLGMEIHQATAGIFISQRKYAWDILKRFKMERCKSVPTPLVHNEKISKFERGDKADPTVYRSLIGSLLYLTATRPDLMFAASLLSRFMQAPSQVHLGVAKRTLRYIKGTADYGIWFKREEQGQLMGYSDSDWAGSVDDMKSTSGYAFTLGSGMFSWNSKKQEVVAQSSAEAEYIAAAGATNQALWLRKILRDLEQNDIEATVIKVDNKSAISMAKNPVQHGRSKHINVKFHAIRQAEKDGEVQLVHCSSDQQIADIMTKALPKGKFEVLRAKLGVSKKNLKEEC